MNKNKAKYTVKNLVYLFFHYYWLFIKICIKLVIVLATFGNYLSYKKGKANGRKEIRSDITRKIRNSKKSPDYAKF